MQAKKILKWSAAGALVIAAPLAALNWAVSPAQASTVSDVSSWLANGLGLGPHGWGGQVDYQALLADALGISVDDLEAAMQEADLAAIQQLQDQGLITEDEASLMQARAKLRDYLGEGTLVAEALGITPDELQQALADGKTVADLIDEQGLDRATFQQNLTDARQAAIEQAVGDGVITQDQADQLQSMPHFGLGEFGHGPGAGTNGGGMFGGRGSGPGGMRGGW